jgi:hypothetical protein
VMVGGDVCSSCTIAGIGLAKGVEAVPDRPLYGTLSPAVFWGAARSWLQGCRSGLY